VPARHRPAPGRPVPVSTYRVQLHAGFTFDDAAAIVPYLAALGVSHLYCSPYFQAAAGSTHGYDVVDPGRLNAELGGASGHARLVAACRSAGLGLVADIVPNHLVVSEPESANAYWWDFLRLGDDSAYAGWFDVDRASPSPPLVPVLGDQLGACLDRREIRYDASGLEPVVRYFDHVLPVAPGTEGLASDLLALLDAQHYRLCHWRVGGEELNYRRFFDVSTLAGVRIERPEVFAASSALVLDQVRAGALDGLRIDHPDGLADPAGYLARLAEATGGCWVVVEKILEVDEELPSGWACAGTTGYDTLNRLTGLFTDPAGETELTASYAELTDESTDWAAVAAAAKRLVLDDVLAAEVNRLTDLAVRLGRLDRYHRDHTRRGLREALVELLIAVEVYRAYVAPEPGQPYAVALGQLEAAAGRAREVRPSRVAEVDWLRDLALGRGLDRTDGLRRELGAEFVTRFQQTCGPVMAKGVEDTAFYRYHRLIALNEVGGDPARFGVTVAEFHAAAAAAQRNWPVGMTTLTTHDTKRSEDVRARVAVLSEIPAQWAAAVRAWSTLAGRHCRHGWPDRNTEYLLFQTLVGTWPISPERLVDYLAKASREAKRHTSWTAPNPAYDEALADFARAVLADPEITSQVAAFVARLTPSGRSNALSQKLVQLTMPGVPDGYQGCEFEALSLVDPDNRRPVDYGRRAELLAELDAASAGSVPRWDTDFDAAKLLVVSRAVRMRRRHPAVFGVDSSYRPLPADGAKAAHVVAFTRADAVVTVVPRLSVGLRDGWQDTTVELPAGNWHNALTDEHTAGGAVRLDALLARFPVALLDRD
jgi:(1->4)-alpha-D-glucan 1-alpha-D-glucosylmutase